MIKRASLVKDNVYGDFEPSESAAILFIVLFFLAGFIIVAQLYHYRKQTPNSIFATFLFMGTPILELVGFAIRFSSVLAPSNSGLYLANMIILSLGPLYLTAINWLVFPALITYVGPRYSVWKPRAFAIQTCILLISCIQLTARGAAQAYNYSEDQSFRNGGSGVMLGGLGLTLGLWIAYAILFAIFLSRYFAEHSLRESSRIRAIFLALGVNIVVITIRTVFRIVEFSVLIRKAEKLNELWLYLGDAAPTFIGVMAFAFVLPYELPYGSIFKGERGCFRTNTERQREIPCDSSINSVRDSLEDEA